MKSNDIRSSQILFQEKGYTKFLIDVDDDDCDDDDNCGDGVLIFSPVTTAPRLPETNFAFRTNVTSLSAVGGMLVTTKMAVGQICLRLRQYTTIIVIPYIQCIYPFVTKLMR